MFYAGRQLPGTPHCNCRVESNDLHAQFERRVCDFDADGAKSNDTECLAGQFKTDELFLAGLDGLVECFARIGQTFHILPGVTKIARRHQQPGDREFFYRIGVRAGRIENRHTASGHDLADG